MAGISAATIRHYEKLGLLKPAARGRNNYRNYDRGALARVQMIRRALGIGFSLRELAAILTIRDQGGVPCRSAFERAKAKLDSLEGEIEDLKAVRRHLKGVLEDWSVRLSRTAKGHPSRLLENLPEGVEEYASVFHRGVGRGLRKRGNGRTKARGESSH